METLLGSSTFRYDFFLKPECSQKIYKVATTPFRCNVVTLRRHRKVIVVTLHIYVYYVECYTIKYWNFLANDPITIYIYNTRPNLGHWINLTNGLTLKSPNINLWTKPFQIENRRVLLGLSLSYTMVRAHVRCDNARAWASALSHVHVQNHGITDLSHLHACRSSTSRDISC